MSWTNASLQAVLRGGLINEDVMQQIFDISRIPLPVQDRIATDSVMNSYAEWTTDKLAAPGDNKRIDGSASTGNNAIGGLRVGNQCQISSKIVTVSTRAQDVDTIGRANELSYQIMQRQRELRRDVDRNFLQPYASIKDDGAATAGQAAGLPSWIETNTSRGAAGADGGFDTGTGLVAAPTPGTQRGLTETLVRDIAQQVYEQGGNPTVLMSVPTVIRRLSEYMFTSSARIATLQQDQGVKAQTAVGAVNVFIHDFGTLEMVPNRLQSLHNDATGTPVPVASVFIMDPSMLRLGILTGYRTESLAKTGLSDTSQMIVDWTVKVLNEAAQGLIDDINPVTAVVT
jgi:hypothetical protein